MAENIDIGRDLPDEEKYIKLILIIKNLLSRDDNVISNLANLSAAIKQAFSKVSWAGFYLMDGKALYLGPFQGKIACTKIELGKGVCGTSALKGEAIIVPDVNKFPGHIACDNDSRSEIVVPVFKNKKLYGVLDLDSTELNSFNETDKHFLQEICNFLSVEILES